MSRSAYRSVIKPAFDRVVGLALLLLLSPVLAGVALAVRIQLGRPILFVQKRVGYQGRHFDMYKFRTMEADRRVRDLPYDGTERRRTHKSEDDPRHTRLGRFLRASSLDELPQLWNVVNGTMSLVGPRPELVSIVARYDDWQHRRHDVKPGLTGLWQVSQRGDRMMHEATEIDLEYIDRLSLRVDLEILARTAVSLVRRTGG